MRFIVRFDRTWDEDGDWVEPASSVPAFIRSWSQLILSGLLGARPAWKARFIRYEYMADGSGSRFYYIVFLPEAKTVGEATRLIGEVTGGFQVLFVDRG